MNVIALDLPDTMHDWPMWLERQLVGLQLRELIAQLEVIAGVDTEQNTLAGNDWNERLENLLGEQQDEVLQSGLSVLSEVRLRSLVQNPRLLLVLQERIFIDGGEYWHQVPRTDEHRQRSDTVQDRVVAATQSTAQVATSSLEPVAGPANRRTFMMFVAAMAASVLIGVFVWQNRQPEGKFFARRGLLESNATGHEFLEQLASAIQDDWRSSQGDADFDAKLTQLRDSCDVLLAADLHQLDPAIAADLKQRCRNWRDKFTEQLAELATGKPTAEVRQQADATVDRLVGVIRGLT